jgi:23S rRNA (cytosine1962-C5)-methyltransferase
VTPTNAIKLKANAKPRVLQGHPWVFVNEIEAPISDEYNGELVECRDRSNRFLGVGIYNSKSQIIWRRLEKDRVVLDEAYIRKALTSAISKRTESVTRLVWSESDGLPGLVVDRYDTTLVVQIQTLALEKRSALIGSLLNELVKPSEIVFRNDAPIRRYEGLPLETHTFSGGPWEARWVKIDGFEYWLDLQLGQKTGFYLDQREQHRLISSHVERLVKHGKSVRLLDAFCNQGPFAMHAARAGASEVLGLDSAEDAITAAKKNSIQNKVKADFKCVNVFDWLNDPARNTEALWDIIILDPPPFAKSKSKMEGALRGYKEINLRAMRLLNPGGILATYTCSHHMQDADLRGVISAAAADARKKVHILNWSNQPSDHPVLVTMPESEYLRGYVLQVE